MLPHLPSFLTMSDMSFILKKRGRYHGKVHKNNLFIAYAVCPCRLRKRDDRAVGDYVA